MEIYSSDSGPTECDLSDFLKKHALPASYVTDAERWFVPLASRLVKYYVTGHRQTIVVGINGAQGSGKSTLADLLVYLLEKMYNLTAIALSLDDFYLTKQQRQKLAINVHPLLKTRGVPGTHDIHLASKTIKQLINGQVTVVPRFNKAKDDRYPQHQWDKINKPVDIIILEGWCLGVQAQEPSSLIDAVNDLEAEEDKKQIWRQYVNQKMQTDYSEFYKLVHRWVMLQAPSFSCVYDWRLEQERKLSKSIGKSDGLMNHQDIARFIKHFQRITEHGLTTLPEHVDDLFELDQNRAVTNAIVMEPQNE